MKSWIEKSAKEITQSIKHITNENLLLLRDLLEP